MSEFEYKPEMVWLDLETTGINEDEDVPLEMGIVLTDRNGNFVDSFQSLILSPHWGTKLKAADPKVQEMHGVSGLWGDLHRNWMRSVYPGQLSPDVDWDRDMFSPTRVQTRAISLLNKHGIEMGKMPLCGSSVHFDRAFIKRHFPLLDKWFSYRHIDVSTIKELCKMLNPAVAEGYKAATEGVVKMHRVIPDIDASITEYVFYKHNFLHGE